MSSVANVLSGAKSTLQRAQDFTKSVEGTPTGRFAPKTSIPRVAPKAKPTFFQQQESEGRSVAEGLRANRQNVTEYNKIYPKMHKGGVVPGKSGEEKVVKLEAGERVIPAKEKKMADEKKDKKVKKDDSASSKVLSVKDVLAKDKAAHSMPDKKGKKSRIKHTHIEHHSDGSHTIRHTPAEGEEMSYSRPDLEGMLQGVKENVGAGQGPEEGPVQAPPTEGGVPQE